MLLGTLFSSRQALDCDQGHSVGEKRASASSPAPFAQPKMCFVHIGELHIYPIS